MMTKSQVILLSEIVEKIYTIEDYTEMRNTLLDMLGALIPYARASYYLAAREKNHLLEAPVGKGISETELQRYIDEYEDRDYTRWIFMSGKPIVYRETDLFNDTVREHQAYYKEVYLPANIYYSAQLSIASGGKFLGIISLYRSKEEPDFNDLELFILNILKNHLENRAIIEIKKRGVDNLNNKSYFDAYHYIESYGLTTREVEVLGLLFAGIANEIICNTLSISSNTLKKHSISIYKKLGINNRWELINFKQ